jgi:Tol biopolymer transport system component
MSNRAGSWNIYSQELGSRNAKSVLTGPGDETNPVLSPDGAFLLYVAREVDDSPETARVMRMPFPSGPSEPIAEVRSAFATVRCPREPSAPCVLGERVEGELVLSVFDPVHGRGDEITRFDYALSSGTPRLTGWDLSPDGTRLAVLQNYPGRIRIIPLAGGEPRVIELPKRGDGRSHVPLQAGWSADGEGLFVTTEVPAGTIEAPVFYVDATGQAQVLFELEGTFGFSPRPSPNGRYLALGILGFDSNAWLVEDF